MLLEHKDSMRVLLRTITVFLKVMKKRPSATMGAKVSESTYVDANASCQVLHFRDPLW